MKYKVLKSFTLFGVKYKKEILSQPKKIAMMYIFKKTQTR